MRPLLLFLLIALAACGRKAAPPATASAADSATAAMDQMPVRPDQDSVRLDGTRYAMEQAGRNGARTFSVTLAPEGQAELRLETRGTPPTVTTGAWKDEGDGLVSTHFDKQEMMWRRTDDSLVALAYDVGEYGPQGLHLRRASN